MCLVCTFLSDVFLVHPFYCCFISFPQLDRPNCSKWMTDDASFLQNVSNHFFLLFFYGCFPVKRHRSIWVKVEELNWWWKFLVSVYVFFAPSLWNPFLNEGHLILCMKIWIHWWWHILIKRKWLYLVCAFLSDVILVHSVYCCFISFPQWGKPNYSKWTRNKLMMLVFLQNVSDYFFLLLFIGCFSHEATPIYLGESRGINQWWKFLVSDYFLFAPSLWNPFLKEGHLILCMKIWIH